jgi:hypothetical protein
MDENQKRKFDAISTLRSWAWVSFDRRRDFEWKLSIGVWTALAALIGILLTRDISIQVWVIRCGSILFAAALFFGHLSFLIGVAIAQNADRGRAEFYDDLLEREFGPFLTAEIKDKHAAHIGTRNYSFGFQVCITLLLCGCLIGIIFSK